MRRGPLHSLLFPPAILKIQFHIAKPCFLLETLQFLYQFHILLSFPFTDENDIILSFPFTDENTEA